MTTETLKDVSCEKDGTEIFSNNNKTSFTRYEKQILKILIYKGTPDSYRKKLWLIGSGAQRSKNNNPNYYQNLLSYSTKVHSASEMQIDLDVKRTYPDNPICSTDSFISKLKNVLLCYAIRNSSIGYCQGMNFIVGRLLLTIDNEEEVFWLFAQIIESLLPLNYYSELAGVITETTMISFLIQKFLPSIHEYFAHNHYELTVNNFIHKWLVSIFTQNFDTNLTMVIWDYFFLEGNIILSKACLGVFALLKNDILTQNEFEDFYNVLNDKTNEIKQPIKLVYFLAVRSYQYDNNTLNAFRSVLQQPIVENLNTEKNKRAITHQQHQLQQPNANGDHMLKGLSLYQKKKEERVCNPKWPSCLYDESANHDILSVLVLKYPKKINVISDYYYSKATAYPLKEGIIDEFHASCETDVLCERKKHCCVDRKIVENSVVFLGQGRTRSNSFNNNYSTKEGNGGNTDVYEIINKGTNFAIVKEKLITEFYPEPISNEELTHLYDEFE